MNQHLLAKYFSCDMETLLTANIWNFDNALLKAGKFCKKQFNAVIRTWILLKVGGSCLRVNDQYQQYLCRSVKVSSYKHQVTSLIFFFICTTGSSNPAKHVYSDEIVV